MKNDLNRLPIPALATLPLRDVARPRDTTAPSYPHLRELPRSVAAILGRGCGRLEVVRRAALIAGNIDADLTVLLHSPDGASVRTHEQLRKAAAQANFWRARAADDSPTRAELITGRLTPAVAAWVSDRPVAPQVLVADRRDVLRTGLRPAPFGRLLAANAAPVLSVAAHGPTTYRRVILALDASEASARAVRTARALGLLERAQVTVVHAFFAHARAKLAYVGAGRARIARHVVETSIAARRGLTAFLRQEGLASTDWDLMVEEGHAPMAVLEAIRRVRPELVVVGAHATGRLRLLRGSTASAIAQEAACDVLAVPTRRAERA